MEDQTSFSDTNDHLESFMLRKGKGGYSYFWHYNGPAKLINWQMRWLKQSISN